MTQKKNNLKWNLLFYTLSFVCFLVFSNTVKASINTLEFTGSWINIPANDGNSILICSILADYDQGATIYNNAVAMTSIAHSGSDWGQEWAYTLSPSAGGHEITSGWNNYNNGSPKNCLFIDYVDITNPFANTPTAVNIWAGTSFSYGNAAADNVLLHLLVAKPGSLTVMGGSNPLYSYVVNAGRMAKMIVSGSISAGGGLDTYTITSTDGETRSYFLEINTIPAIPPSHDFISPVLTDGNVDVEVCGSTEICEGDKLSNWQVIYDICDSWDYSSIFEIGMENSTHTNVNEYLTDPYLFIGPRTASQCRGSFQYREFFNENIGYENWHFFLRKTTATTTETIYFENFVFEVATLPEIIYSNGFILYTGSNPKIINTSLGAGTSTIPFQFNVCGDEEWENSQFVLENLDTNELLTIATSTDVCAGTDILELPYADKFVNSLNARINLVNASSTNKILGNSFNIIWQLTDKPILETCKMPSYDVNDICEDIDTSNMLGDIKCGLKYAIVVSAQFLFYPSCSSLTSISDTYDSFKQAFPFNIFFDFTGSIDEAIDTSLNSTTHTNSISLPFIRQTATSTEYYMLPVMSTTTISNTIGSSGYNTIRTTLEYIYWVLAGFIIFLLILKK